MSYAGRAKKRDDNEAEIIRSLRATGASVTQLDGDGVPDLLVGHRGQTVLMEVKNPTRPGGKAQSRDSMGGAGELTSAQVMFWSSWKGRPIYIVHTAGEALKALDHATR